MSGAGALPGQVPAPLAALPQGALGAWGPGWLLNRQPPCPTATPLCPGLGHTPRPHAQLSPVVTGRVNAASTWEPGKHGGGCTEAQEKRAAGEDSERDLSTGRTCFHLHPGAAPWRGHGAVPTLLRRPPPDAHQMAVSSSFPKRFFRVLAWPCSPRGAHRGVLLPWGQAGVTGGPQPSKFHQSGAADPDPAHAACLSPGPLITR